MEEPERYESYWITYFDLLGFESVVRQPENIACRLKNEGCRPRIWYTLEHFRKAREEFIDLKRVYGTQGIWFSDTFLFYTKDESHDCLIRMVNASGNFFRRMFRSLIPVRGCLAYGDLYSGPHDELFGPVLIDAYREAEAQDWLGFIIHRTAAERIELYEKNGRSVRDAMCAWDYVDYAVPFKTKILPDAQESPPVESPRRLVFSLVNPNLTHEQAQFLLRDSDHMQSIGEDLIEMDKDLTREERDKKRRDVRTKHENTRQFLRSRLRDSGADVGTSGTS